MKDINDPDDWMDVTGDFEFSFSAASPREVQIDPKAGKSWTDDRDYRITHEEGDLQVAPGVLTTTSANIHFYEYEFCYIDN